MGLVKHSNYAEDLEIIRQATVAPALFRAVSHDGHSIAGSNVWEIIPNRIVLRASIVPESNGVLSPLKTALEGRVLHMRKEELKDSIALCPGKSNNALSKH